MNKEKTISAPHIFIVLCAYTVITSIYTHLIIDFEGMVMRLLSGIIIIFIFLTIERSKIKRAVTAFLSPTLITAVIILSALYFNGDGLVYYYLSCVAFISLSYFSLKGLAAYILTSGTMISVTLFIFNANLLGQSYTMLYNIISFAASMGICALAFFFCLFNVKMLKELDDGKTLLNTGNGIAEMMLSTAGKGNIEEVLLESLGIIGRAVSADRVQIWKNEHVNGVHYYINTYEWMSELGMAQPPVPKDVRFPYSATPGWEALFSGGECINSPFDKLSQGNKLFLDGFGIKSIAIIPIFLQERFWGFFDITDYHQERQFSDEEINILRSAGLMITNALLCDDLIRSTRANAAKLEIALDEAEAANHAKSAFLSTMSHEIRTPLNAIIGIAEIQYQNENLGPSEKEAMDKIYTSGDLLLGIINDILDLSKIEAGKLELLPSSYEIASLINDTAQLNVMRIGSKPIYFTIEVDENIPSVLIGDELRIKQILNNLLSNAFKYTSEGTVHLAVSSEKGRNDSEVMIVFSVSDTGQGMSPEQISKLFDEYSRFNMEANRTTEGTGLGMNITKNLIKMMRGDIEVDSEPGRGSKFIVRIPQEDTKEGVLGKEMTEQLKQFRTNHIDHAKAALVTHEPMPYGSVLIVDDVETNIYVANGLMAPYGLKIDTADSGFTAINKLKAGNVYDIVFMDHMMPIMDGIETTKNIREMGYEGIIVALTANAVSGQMEKFLKSGFDDFISKPIDIHQLDNALIKHIRDKQPPEVIEAARNTATVGRNALGAPSDPGTPSNSTPSTPPPGAIDPKFAEIFARDARKALAVLEEISKGDYGEDDLRSYVINVHGMKSALANIGKKDLSAVALKLEQMGRDGNTDAVKAETPEFLTSLNAVIDEIAPKQEDTQETADDDVSLLKEKLEVIKSACELYDETSAEAALSELREKKWSPKVNDLLNTISEHLLHSDFDEISAAIDEFISKISEI
ncbi:MAG: ATP-binding protein [Oscillospiraceae bacterium]|nr:ATP-binding protein [Oscillospiraceae bacterium]